MDNLNASKISSFLKNKNTVTAICAVLIVVILLVAYKIRVDRATTPSKVPVANVTIQPRTEITADMISYINVPKSALNGNYYSNIDALVGKYTNVNTIVPQGSLFYAEAVITKEELPDAILFEKPEGETLYNLAVNMRSTYTNSILPGNYIDLYITTKENGKALVGKLLSNIKVLAVKTGDGKNVFENTEEVRVPATVYFSVPEEQFLLLRSIEAINSYSAYDTAEGSSKIDVVPVPTSVTDKGLETKLVANVSSQYLKSYIETLSQAIQEENGEIKDVQETQETPKNEAE